MELPQIQITVNGQARTAESAGPHTNLLTWLRDQGLTGAKEGCAEGECGACAVMVARADGATHVMADGDAPATYERSVPAMAGQVMPDGGASGAMAGAAARGTVGVAGGTADSIAARTRWTAINACLVPALAFDGQEIVTAEGLGTAPGAGSDGDLHPVQREMADRGGSQCGYCTPGFICSMAAEYYRPDRAAVSDRATVSEPAAQPQIPAASSASAESAPESEHSTDHMCGANGFDLHALSGNLCRCTGYRPIRDAAYALGDAPPEDPLLRRLQEPAPPMRRTQAGTNGAQFIRPATLGEFLDLYTAEPDAALLAGATDLGVDINLRHARPPLVLAIDHLPELRTLDVTGDQIEIGAALTLSELERALAGQVPLLAEMFPQFASPLIRNTASLGGNIATASPIGDAAPVLLALDATLLLTSSRGDREVDLAEFFTGYRETVRAPGEVIRAVRIPRPLAPRSAFHKIAKRRFDDISSVAVAIAMWIGGEQPGSKAHDDGEGPGSKAHDDGEEPDGGRVTQVRIGLGGVAATPIRASATEAVLTGQPWTAETAREAAAILATEGTPMDDHRASARYRAAMLEQALFRFFDLTRHGEGR